MLPGSGCLGGLRAGGEGTAGWEVTPNPAAPHPGFPASSSPRSPRSSPLFVPSPRGFSIRVGQSRSRGLHWGAPARHSAPLPLQVRLPKATLPLLLLLPAALQGRATPAGAGRLLTPHTGLSSCARGVLNTFFHSSPPSQLAPCERERRWPHAGAVQGDTAGDTWCCHPTPGAAPAPDSSSTSSAGGCSPLCVFWGGGG